MMLLKESLSVMAGGALGSLGRFGLSRWIQSVTRFSDYPWGIFVCNVLGCFVMGILAGILIHRLEVGPLWRATLMIGFLGGFTTFSSFTLDTITLLQQGDMMSALSNILLTLFFCLLATVSGLLITNSLIVS